MRLGPQDVFQMFISLANLFLWICLFFSNIQGFIFTPHSFLNRLSGYKYLHSVFKVVFVYTCTHTNRNTNLPMFMNLTDNQKLVNKTDYIFEIKLCGEKKMPRCFLCVLRHRPPYD